MKLILVLLAFGIIVLIGSMVMMWYLFVLAFLLLMLLAGFSYLIIFTLVERLTNNPEIAQIVGVSITATIFLGAIIWAYKSGKLDTKSNPP